MAKDLSFHANKIKENIERTEEVSAASYRGASEALNAVLSKNFEGFPAVARFVERCGFSNEDVISKAKKDIDAPLSRRSLSGLFHEVFHEDRVKASKALEIAKDKLVTHSRLLDKKYSKFSEEIDGAMHGFRYIAAALGIDASLERDALAVEVLNLIDPAPGAFEKTVGWRGVFNSEGRFYRDLCAKIDNEGGKRFVDIVTQASALKRRCDEIYGYLPELEKEVEAAQAKYDKFQGELSSRQAALRSELDAITPTKLIAALVSLAKSEGRLGVIVENLNAHEGAEANKLVDMGDAANSLVSVLRSERNWLNRQGQIADEDELAAAVARQSNFVDTLVSNPASIELAKRFDDDVFPFRPGKKTNIALIGAYVQSQVGPDVDQQNAIYDALLNGTFESVVSRVPAAKEDAVVSVAMPCTAEPRL